MEVNNGGLLCQWKLDEAYWEKGLFALQHTACRLTSSFTIEKVSQHFDLTD